MKEIRNFFLRPDCASQLFGSFKQNIHSTLAEWPGLSNRNKHFQNSPYVFFLVQANLGTTDFRDRTYRSQRLITIGNEEKGQINRD